MILTLSGQLIVAPANATDPSSFPSASTSFDFSFPGGQVQLNVDTGPMRPNVNSPSALVAVPGVGTAGPVTNGLLLKWKSTTPFLVELTTYNASGNVVAVIPLQGEQLLNFDPSHYLVGLRVQGAGQIEYYIAGQQ